MMSLGLVLVGTADAGTLTTSYPTACTTRVTTSISTSVACDCARTLPEDWPDFIATNWESLATDARANNTCFDWPYVLASVSTEPSYLKGPVLKHAQGAGVTGVSTWGVWDYDSHGYELISHSEIDEIVTVPPPTLEIPIEGWTTPGTAAGSYEVRRDGSPITAPPDLIVEASETPGSVLWFDTNDDGWEDILVTFPSGHQVEVPGPLPQDPEIVVP